MIRIYSVSRWRNLYPVDHLDNITMIIIHISCFAAYVIMDQCYCMQCGGSKCNRFHMTLKDEPQHYVLTEVVSFLAISMC